MNFKALFLTKRSDVFIFIIIIHDIVVYYFIAMYITFISFPRPFRYQLSNLSLLNRI